MDKEGTAGGADGLAVLTDVFRLLSDKTRLKILLILSRGERNVSSLCGELGLPQPTVSHHLGLLRMNELISHRRAGKLVFYGLNGRIGAAPGSGLLIHCAPFTVNISGETGIDTPEENR